MANPLHPNYPMKLRLGITLSINLVLAVMGFSTHAMETPLRDPGQLWEAQAEEVLPVKSARVVVADYGLIRRDFPEVASYDNQQIDQWLVRNAAYVSKQQAAQDIVNSPIQTGSEKRQAFRPREYRRAHVFVADTGGLIDAKGSGSVDPSPGSHDNGLATLGDMIREYSYEKMINAIFQRDGRYETVGSYAVIDFGFDIKHPEGGTSRAGLVLRQAHTRFHNEIIGSRTRNQPTMLPKDFQLEVELFLRQFGITSTVKFKGVELINLQGSTTMAVIDFGAFLTDKQFVKDVYHFYDPRGTPSLSRDSFVMRPGTPDFIQPSENRIPFDVWGYSQTGKADSKYDNLFIWSHELAQSWAEGRAHRHDVDQHFKNLFDRADVQKVFASIAPSCRAIFKR